MPRVAKNSRDDGARDVPSPPDGDSVRQEIARRAYLRYSERGRIDGFDVEDWLAAELEILQELEAAAAVPARRSRSAARRGSARAAPAADR